MTITTTLSGIGKVSKTGLSSIINIGSISAPFILKAATLTAGLASYSLEIAITSAGFILLIIFKNL